MMKEKILIGIVGAMSSWLPDNNRLTANHFNGNSYPINNKRGHAAKQKREAKKARRK